MEEVEEAAAMLHNPLAAVPAAVTIIIRPNPLSPIMTQPQTELNLLTCSALLALL